MWGRFESGELVAACHVGANLVPVQCTADDARAFAERALTRGRTVSTIVGPQDAVEVFWNGVASGWGKPRETRWQQPHLQIAGDPAVAPDPEVRRTTRKDMDELYPACVDMYTEEVGISPEYGGGAELYRARVSQLMNRGWSFARFDDGRLVFKAEVACATPHAAQIQGVWVPPDRRGEGLAAAGMAAVVELVRRDVAPVVPSTSTTGTSRRDGPTRRWASRRPPASPRSCSERSAPGCLGGQPVETTTVTA